MVAIVILIWKTRILSMIIQAQTARFCLENRCKFSLLGRHFAAWVEVLLTQQFYRWWKEVSDMAIDHTNQKRATLDRISNLPKEVMDEIHARMPIRDAVKTSMLSQSWRYKWMYMPELIFDRLSIPLDGKQHDSTLVNFVNNVLLLHNDVILKFELNHFLGRGCSYVDRWIMVLLRKNVNHIILKFEGSNVYQLPASLFSCQTLRTVALEGCILKLPTHFQGLSCLTCLRLWRVDLSNKAFESLLVKIPLLEKLKVVGCGSLTHFNVHAPNLWTVVVHGLCHSITFKNMPRLKRINIRIWGPLNCVSCNLDAVIGSLIKLSYIRISRPVLEFTSIVSAPKRLNNTYHHLKYVKLHVDFEDLKQILAVLCLCRSSPCLRELYVMAVWDKRPAFLCENLFWKEQSQREGDIDMLRQLKSVTIMGFKGVRNQVEFVEFILLNAASLETLGIKWEKSVLMDRELLHVLEKMIRFRRASSKAEVIFSGFQQSNFPL